MSSSAGCGLSRCSAPRRNAEAAITTPGPLDRAADRATIGAAINAGALLADSGLPQSESRALLAHLLGRPREYVLAHPELAVDALTTARFDQLAIARRDGVPLAYLLGEREFYGRSFCVTPAVLVPRPETERLVECALDCLSRTAAARVLDLGTGSGCIAITLALERPDADVIAVERSEAALDVARHNAQALGARVAFLAGSWYAPVRGRFNMIVANPPYVAAGDPHLQALRHEPIAALVAPSDGLSSEDGPSDGGLSDLRSIVTGAAPHLAPAGWLAVEHGHEQAPAVRDLFSAAGFEDVTSLLDLQGIERVVRGRRR